MKKLLIVVALLSVSNSCFAYNDYGYSYGLSNGTSGGYNASMGIRESQNDFNNMQQRQAPSIAATVYGAAHQGDDCYRQQRQPQQSQSYVNPNRSYVIDKPLPLNGIGPYDAYGGIK